MQMWYTDFAFFSLCQYCSKFAFNNKNALKHRKDCNNFYDLKVYFKNELIDECSCPEIAGI